MLKKYKSQLESSFLDSELSVTREEIEYSEPDPDTVLFRVKKEHKLYFKITEALETHHKFSYEYCGFEKKFPVIADFKPIQFGFLYNMFNDWLLSLNEWKMEYEEEENFEEQPKLLGYTDFSDDTPFSSEEKEVLEQDIEKILDYVKTIGLLPEKLQKLEEAILDIKEQSETMGKFSWKNYAHGKLADLLIEVSINMAQIELLRQVFKAVLSGGGFLPISF